MPIGSSITISEKAYWQGRAAAHRTLTASTTIALLPHRAVSTAGRSPAFLCALQLANARKCAPGAIFGPWFAIVCGRCKLCPDRGNPHHYCI